MSQWMLLLLLPLLMWKVVLLMKTRGLIEVHGDGYGSD